MFERFLPSFEQALKISLEENPLARLGFTATDKKPSEEQISRRVGLLLTCLDGEHSGSEDVVAGARARIRSAPTEVTSFGIDYWWQQLSSAPDLVAPTETLRFPRTEGSIKSLELGDQEAVRNLVLDTILATGFFPINDESFLKNGVSFDAPVREGEGEFRSVAEINLKDADHRLNSSYLPLTSLDPEGKKLVMPTPQQILDTLKQHNPENYHFAPHVVYGRLCPIGIETKMIDALRKQNVEIFSATRDGRLVECIRLRSESQNESLLYTDFRYKGRNCQANYVMLVAPYTNTAAVAVHYFSRSADPGFDCRKPRYTVEISNGIVLRDVYH